MSLCVWGRAYLVYRDGTLNCYWPKDLRYDRRRKIYERRVENRVETYAVKDVLTVSYPAPVMGDAPLSPYQSCLNSAQVTYLADTFNRRFFSDSGRPDYLMLTEHTLTDRELDDFYDKWDSRFAGRNRRPALSNLIRDVKPLGLTHQDMDFLRGLHWTLREVCRSFGVPPPVVGDFADASLSNVRAAERFFWRDTILPDANLLSSALTRWLPPLLGESGLVVGYEKTAIQEIWEHETEGRRSDVRDVEVGISTINEVRARRGQAPVGWGDIPPWEREGQGDD